MAVASIFDQPKTEQELSPLLTPLPIPGPSDTPPGAGAPIPPAPAPGLRSGTPPVAGEGEPGALLSPISDQVAMPLPGVKPEDFPGGSPQAAIEIDAFLRDENQPDLSAYKVGVEQAGGAESAEAGLESLIRRLGGGMRGWKGPIDPQAQKMLRLRDLVRGSWRDKTGQVTFVPDPAIRLQAAIMYARAMNAAGVDLMAKYTPGPSRVAQYVPFLRTIIGISRDFQKGILGRRLKGGKISSDDLMGLAAFAVDEENQAKHGWLRDVAEGSATVADFAAQLIGAGVIAGAAAEGLTEEGGLKAAKKILEKFGERGAAKTTATAEAAAGAAAKAGIGRTLAETGVKWAVRGGRLMARPGTYPFTIGQVMQYWGGQSAPRPIPQEQATIMERPYKLHDDMQSLIKAIPKGLVSSFIELGTEQMGEDLVEGSKFLAKWAGKPVTKRIPDSAKKIVASLYGAAGSVLRRLRPKGETAKALEQLSRGVARRAHWDGLAGEYLEEIVGDALHGLSGTAPNYGMVGQLASGQFGQFAKQSSEVIASLGLFPAGSAVIQRSYEAVRGPLDYAAKKRMRERRNRLRRAGVPGADVIAKAPLGARRQTRETMRKFAESARSAIGPVAFALNPYGTEAVDRFLSDTAGKEAPSRSDMETLNIPSSLLNRRERQSFRDRLLAIVSIARHMDRGDWNDVAAVISASGPVDQTGETDGARLLAELRKSGPEKALADHPEAAEALGLRFLFGEDEWNDFRQHLLSPPKPAPTEKPEAPPRPPEPPEAPKIPESIRRASEAPVEKLAAIGTGPHAYSRGSAALAAAAISGEPAKPASLREALRKRGWRFRQGTSEEIETWTQRVNHLLKAPPRKLQYETAKYGLKLLDEAQPETHDLRSLPAAINFAEANRRELVAAAESGDVSAFQDITRHGPRGHAFLRAAIEYALMPEEVRQRHEQMMRRPDYPGPKTTTWIPLGDDLTPPSGATIQRTPAGRYVNISGREEEPYAKRKPQTTQLHGDVQQPEGPQEGEGEMPAPGGGPGVPGGGQGGRAGEEEEAPPTEEEVEAPEKPPRTPPAGASRVNAQSLRNVFGLSEAQSESAIAFMEAMGVDPEQVAIADLQELPSGKYEEDLWNRLNQLKDEGARAAAAAIQGGGALIVRLNEGADLNTFIHELGHVLHFTLLSRRTPDYARAGVTLDEIRELERVFGVTEKGWTRAQAEEFANSLRDYFNESQAPAGLRGLYEKLRRFLKRFLLGIQPPDNMRADVREFFDQLRAKQEQTEAPTEEGAPGEELGPPSPFGSKTGDQRFAELVRQKLLAGESIAKQEDFVKLAVQAYGATAGEGGYILPQAYDAMEAGIAAAIASDPTIPDADTPEGLEARQAWIRQNIDRNTPPQRQVRSAEKIRLQQYSTPPEYAAAAAYLGEIGPDDIVLEPSAGSGILAAYARRETPHVFVNEIAAARRRLLEGIRPEAVYNEDAGSLNALLTAAKAPRPDVVLMNPPFSKPKLGAKKSVSPNLDLKHVDEALKFLKDGGRLVAIVGGGMRGERPALERWLDQKAEQYQIVADIAVPGDAYKRHMTRFPTRLIVIDKLPPEEETDQERPPREQAYAPPKKGKRKRPTTAPAVQAMETPRRRGRRPKTATIGGLGDLSGVIGGMHNEGRLGKRAAAKSRVPKTAGGRTGRGNAPQPPTGAGAGGGAAPPEGRRPPVVPGGNVGGAGSHPSGQPGGEPGLPPTGGPEPTGGPKAQAGGEEAGGGGAQGGQEAGPEAGEGRAGGGPPPGVGGELEKRARDRVAAADPDDVYAPYEVTYKPYKGAKALKGAELAESIGLAGVALPPIDYKPDLPAEAIKSGELADSQIEAIAYAGNAHSQHVRPEGVQVRRAMMIGDGTGTGKTRVGMGVILDNWRRGRRRAVWVSPNQRLYDQAVKHWTAMGGDPGDLLLHHKIRTAEIPDRDAILFTTYQMLWQERGEEDAGGRLRQITDWMGPDSDGVIVFDESHLMRSVGHSSTEGSKRATAGLQLMRDIPDARVLFLSATPAVTVGDMRYAERLGLWGPGTAFSNREKFIEVFEGGGLGAMEKLAADMKAMGVYMAKTLSMKGVTYEFLDCPPDKRMVDNYRTYAEAWLRVAEKFEEGVQDAPSQARGYLRSNFYSAHQRFFHMVMLNSMLPKLFQQLHTDIDNDHAPVIQSHYTFGAPLKRAADAYEGGDWELFALSPKADLINLIRRHFPVYATTEDENGNPVYVTDRKGNRVPDPEKEAKRDALIREIEGIRELATLAPADMLIEEFGADKVAEMTGRTVRIVRNEKGERERQPFDSKMAQRQVGEFMGGERIMLFFSDAGGTGADYQAAIGSGNTKLRRHYVLDPSYNIISTVQAAGRTHRVGQAQPPVIILVRSGIPAHRRLLSSVARRLATLGAVARGHRQASSGAILSEADNLEGRWAEIAVNHLAGRYQQMGPPDGVPEKHIGFIFGKIKWTGAGDALPWSEPKQFLNRLMGVPVETQEKVFEDFQQLHSALIEDAAARGEIDTGIQTIRGDSIVAVEDTPVKEHPTGQTTRYLRLKVRRARQLPTAKAVESLAANGRYYWSRRGAQPVFIIPQTGARYVQGATVDTDTYIYPSGRREREPSDKKENTRYWEPMDEREARRKWETAQKDIEPYVESTEHMLTGLLLPVWDRLGRVPARLRRAKTDDGRGVIGLLMNHSEIQHVLSNLGYRMRDEERVSPDAALRGLWDGRMSVVLGNQWQLTRVVFGREHYIEAGGGILTGPSLDDEPYLREKGAEVQIINHTPRVLFPRNEKSNRGLLELMREKDIASVSERGLGNDKPFSERAFEFLQPTAKEAEASEPVAKMTGEKAAAPQGELKPKTWNPRPDDVTGEPVSAKAIINGWSRMFGVPIRYGRIAQRRAAGIYKQLEQVVRITEKHWGNLLVASHEVGHHIDALTGVTADDGARLPAVVRQELRQLDYKPKRGDVSEGWAEFIRHMIVDADQETYSAVNDWVKNHWAKKHPDLWRKLNKARAYAIRHSEQGVLARYRAERAMLALPAGVPRVQLTSELLVRRGQSFYQNWKHRFYALQRVGEEAVAKGYRPPRGILSWQIAMGYTMGAIPHTVSAVETGIWTVGMAKAELVGPSLRSVADLRQDPEDAERANLWALARHAARYYEVFPDGNCGISLEEAEEILKHPKFVEHSERYDRYAKAISTYARGLLEVRINAGNMSRDEKNFMMRVWPTYFPLKRLPSGEDWPDKGLIEMIGVTPRPLAPTGGMAHSGRQIRGRSPKGSGRPIMDPIDALLIDTVKTYRESMNQVVVDHLLREASSTPGLGRYVEVLPKTMRPSRTLLGTMLKSLVEEGVITNDEAQTIRAIDRLRRGLNVRSRTLRIVARYLKTTLPEKATQEEAAAILLDAADKAKVPSLDTLVLGWRPLLRADDKEHIVRHYYNGKFILVKLDAALHESLAATPPQAVGLLARISHLATVMVKTGAVYLSPKFAAGNIPLDWMAFQFNTKMTGVVKPMTEPVEWLAKYVKYQYYNLMLGVETHEGIKFWREMGGEQVQRYGLNPNPIRRIGKSLRPSTKRQRTLRALNPFMWPGAAMAAWRDVITASDVGPRLAEFNFSMARLGWGINEKGNYYRLDTGKEDTPPRAHMLRAFLDSLDVTVNYRRMGVIGARWDQHIPFLNANIEGIDKTMRTLARLRGLKSGSDEEAARLAWRLLIHLSTIAMLSFLYGYSRAGDDDYEEMQDWLKLGYWSGNVGDTTVWRFPKPRVWQVFINAAESLGAAFRRRNPDAVAKDILKAAWVERPPMLPTLLRGPAEIILDRDIYFGNRIEGPYLREFRERIDRAQPWTLQTSKEMAKVIPFLSPAQIDHLLNSFTGGMYQGAVGETERALRGKSRATDIPIAGRFLLTHRYDRSTAEFQNELAAEKRKVGSLQSRGELTAIAYRRYDEMADYNVLIADIWAATPNTENAAKREPYRRAAVAVARMALGKPPLEGYPNPFTDPKAPRRVVEAAARFLASKMRTARSRRPPARKRVGDQSYAETMAKWRGRVLGSRQWLQSHPVRARVMALARLDLRR